MPCSRAQTKTRGNPDRGTRVPAVHSTHQAAACMLPVRFNLLLQATVMVLLDASAIARNVGRDLVFAASRRAACSHSDLGWLRQLRCRSTARVSDTPLWRAAVRSRTEGTAKPRAPLQCRIPCQACAASAFFCRPGSGAQSVGRRTVPSSKPTTRPKSTRMPGLPRVFVRALACTHANVWWSLQLHELCALHTDSLFPAALAAVLSSCAATVEPSLLRGTARRHRTGPAWASNDALSKALARTRVPQHLAPCTPDY